MIKNLLNADEDPPPGTKVVIEDSIVDHAAAAAAPPPAAAEAAESSEEPAVFEIPGDAKFFTPPTADAGSSSAENAGEPAANAFVDPLAGAPENAPAAATSAENEPPTGKRAEKSDNFSTGTLFQSEAEPPSPGEAIRQSGLAYSAAIVLFGSVVFTMILGWFADLLLGSSPWGIVGGIILGGVIGFIQFFRITSQIFRK